MPGKGSFLKNKYYSAALKHLAKNPADISWFIQQLDPQIQLDPDKYISQISNSRNRPAHKFKFAPAPEDKHKWIQQMGIKTVLDVGAWKGDSVELFHGLFPDAKIYSFEPLPDCFEQLQKLTATVPGFKPFNYALGDKPGKMQMNRSEFSPSSSLLKMKDTHKEAFPFTAAESSEEIEIRTLDSMAGEIDFVPNVLLKIDVQGFEENVLKGAAETLKRVKVIIIELSFVELYAGQPMFDMIYRILLAHGFVYSGSWHQLLKPQDGRILQQNGIFINANV